MNLYSLVEVIFEKKSHKMPLNIAHFEEVKKIFFTLTSKLQKLRKTPSARYTWRDL